MLKWSRPNKMNTAKAPQGLFLTRPKNDMLLIDKRIQEFYAPKKEMQERLLRYFDFGNGQISKRKIKMFIWRYEILSLPIGENIEKINEHIAEFNALVILSDMHIIKTIRESIIFIKEKNEENLVDKK